MALRIHHIPALFSNSPVTIIITHKLNTRISCTGGGSGGGNGISDAALASKLAAKVSNMNARAVQAEEAMRKSRKLLFRQLSDYLGLKEDEAKLKWSNMGEDEKWVLVKSFVADWGAHFHPLSARFTKEMVEEYLQQPQANPSPLSSSSLLFPSFKRIIGFP